MGLSFGRELGIWVNTGLAIELWNYSCRKWIVGSKMREGRVKLGMKAGISPAKEVTNEFSKHPRQVC